jgi:curved DNA-binding protein CbpA
METLYDLLGALPEDGADNLRAAFRSAVKGAHPDIAPGDPNADLKFRRIVRANEILSDEDQRAAYDHLLALADLERRERSKRVAFTTLHQFATGAMTFAVVSLMLTGGYVLFGYFNNTRGPSLAADMSAAEPAKVLLNAFAADLQERASETVGAAGGARKAENPKSETRIAETAKAEPPNVETPKPEIPKTEIPKAEIPKAEIPKAEIPKAIEIPKAMEEPAPPAAVAVADASGTLEVKSGPAVHDAAHDITLIDANAYRQQAAEAYRNGDLRVALSKLDLAISLDPQSSDAYVDRSIVLRRLGDTKNAFADIAKAKRIDEANRR